ncbi:MAG TPA: choice-of-anchor tandem repeat GloVer-containing protein [Terriglobales bacterium]|jgi:uncharacterized repeat protein (TIGR03803 family)|nr:choice-of-anchor tandem repeat GloVer-containing protein [Terriglobales bacterium]
MKTLLLCVVLVILDCGLAMGQQYNVLYDFQGAPVGDGALPFGNLVFDKLGNLYGTTEVGGVNGGCYGGGCGVVFELSPNSDGSWSETVIHVFCASGPPCDGASLGYGLGGLTIDAVGNLYGIEPFGGNYPPACTDTSGCGAAYELSPPSSKGGTWTYTTLYDFCSVLVDGSCEDGLIPISTLTFDASGNLYGTTSGGGSENGGTVFELSPGVGGWTETVLYNFCSGGLPVCPDGAEPEAGVIFDKSGNIYGSTSRGGNSDSSGTGGTIFKLSPGDGGWIESVVYAFQPPPKNSDYNAIGPLSIDPAGDLYVTFNLNIDSYHLERFQGGVADWNHRGRVEKFLFVKNDEYPVDGVIADTSRRLLYGVTGYPGFGIGNIYQVDESKQETVLYNFCSQPSCTDGYLPNGGLLEDKSGNLYGTTSIGGQFNDGVVFELTP